MRYLSLAAFLLATYAAGFIGSFFTMSEIGTWYATLERPALSPPNWVFGPVWSTLYALMAVAAWRIWKHRRETLAKKALILYGINLVLNALWSVAFFGLHNPALALFIIALLLLSIIMLVILFSRLDRWAALLFLPYLFWVSFATYLNLMIVLLN